MAATIKVNDRQLSGRAAGPGGLPGGGATLSRRWGRLSGGSRSRGGGRGGGLGFPGSAGLRGRCPREKARRRLRAPGVTQGLARETFPLGSGTVTVGTKWTCHSEELCDLMDSAGSPGALERPAHRHQATCLSPSSSPLSSRLSGRHLHRSLAAPAPGHSVTPAGSSGAFSGLSRKASDMKLQAGQSQQEPHGLCCWNLERVFRSL
ncbi:translation initiation factor IF-2-like [Pteropus medius]|uniref:translation initiation factor IF-2-like n=1 Tax=Pteropus vampyrus TaxID=132908 RepID=UPI00196AEA9F|nr:translation initiation factor IF-2-like [Pteropus giganteus]